MGEHKPLEIAKDTVTVVAEIVKVAGEDPRVKEAAGNLGETAVTLTKTINNVLVPLAAINFAFDKARAYFSSKFQQDIANTTNKIPPEHLVEPNASIAGPALQGLAFSHDQPSLKDMYLNLLATAMDGRASKVAHPAFVEIIKQLDGEDAALVQDLLKTDFPTPIVRLNNRVPDGSGTLLLATHILNLSDSVTGLPSENENIPAMVDNWVRLGLVEVNYGIHLIHDKSYDWVNARPEYLRFMEGIPADRIEIEKGIMRITELGRRFGRAVGI